MTDLALRVQNLFLSRLVHVLYRCREIPEPARILVLRSSRLGDFICAMPALNLLRKTYPSANILLLTLPSASRLMEGREGKAEWLNLLSPGVVDEIVLFHGGDVYNSRKVLELRRRVTQFDPELIFIFPFSQETALSRFKKIVFLRSMGAKRNLYGWRMKPSAVPSKEGGSAAHQIFGPLNALAEKGIVVDIEKGIYFDIAVDQRARARVDALWREHQLTDKNVVAIFPGGTFEHKRWPLRNFEVFCHSLLTKYPVQLVVVGGEEEEALGAALANVDPTNVHNWVGCTTLTETAEVLRRSVLFVGDDSGVAHLASAVGTPAVTIFSGIEFPGIWEPWYSRHLSVRTPVACQFCFSHTVCPTGTMVCMKGIEVNQVLEKCELLLSRQCDVKREPCHKSQL